MDVLKSKLKKIILPSTSMIDARIDALHGENERLRAELQALRSDFSEAMGLIHSDVCARLDGERVTGAERTRPFVLSVATYAPRFPYIGRALQHLTRQTVRPCKMVVWIPREAASRGLASLPHDALHALMQLQAEVRWVDDDLGPHNKYFWAMQEFRDLPIMTIDDDALLQDDLFESLWRAHETYPNCVIASRTHRMAIEEGGSWESPRRFAAYRNWIQQQKEVVMKPSHALMATGLGGALYPARAFSPEMFDTASIRATCPLGDDLWLKAMELVNDVKVVDCGCGFQEHLVDGSQESALFLENLGNDRNDSYLEEISGYVEKKRPFGLGMADLFERVLAE